jgi:hypothetical protein
MTVAGDVQGPVVIRVNDANRAERAPGWHHAINLERGGSRDEP